MDIDRPESRQELIARIKREQRPAWLHSTFDGPGTNAGLYISGTTFPSAQNTQEEGQRTLGTSFEALGSSIERPRSALHSGDFGAHHTEQGLDTYRPGHERHAGLSTSPPVPWYNSYAGVYQPPAELETQSRHASRPVPMQARHRAVSHSSFSFASRPPTSPLALQSNSIDFASDDDMLRPRSRSPDKTRRQTFSPGSLQTFRSAPLGQSLDLNRGPPPLRKLDTYPRQAHQPRRSISSLHSFSSPQSPIGRSRRGSLLSEGSPLQGAPMVGGYEESILRGRMSTLPSRPLDFVAQIGVLGKGDCKPSLRCPPHLSVPFPAVFYNYGPATVGRGSSDAGPSPYVGMVDLENRSVAASTAAKRQSEHRSSSDTMHYDDVFLMPEDTTPQPKSTKNHRSEKAKAGPKGAYRIPQQGQLQIIIKNPHKTAVKLFLVPYDLSGMQPGQKTFIRQRSYSAGPIIDMPLSARKNLGTDRPEAALTSSDDPKDRPVLRYLIHLHICSPSRGRFYLYKSIRVVFANRVPDGKEKLRNEVQLPEPRYTTYKPDVDSAHNSVHGSPALRPRAPSLAELEMPPILFPSPAHTRRIKPSGPDTGFDLTFRRRPLTAAISEVSSNGSISSGRSSRMAIDGSESGSDLSPKTTRRDVFAASDDPNLIADFPLDQQLGSRAGRLRSQSPLHRSPGNGLLALQLRSWDEAGISEADT